MIGTGFCSDTRLPHTMTFGSFYRPRFAEVHTEIPPQEAEIWGFAALPEEPRRTDPRRNALLAASVAILRGTNRRDDPVAPLGASCIHDNVSDRKTYDYPMVYVFIGTLSHFSCFCYCRCFGVSAVGRESNFPGVMFLWTCLRYSPFPQYPT